MVTFPEYIRDLSDLSMHRFNMLDITDKLELIEWYIEDVLLDAEEDDDMDFFAYLKQEFKMDVETYQSLDINEQIELYKYYADYKGLDDKDDRDLIVDMIKKGDKE